MKKHLSLKTAFLNEDKGPDTDKVNKELGGFKSLLHGDDKTSDKESDDVKDVNKELGKAKWEMNEDIQLENEFGTQEEDPFASAYEKHDQVASGTDKIQNLDDPFSEADGDCLPIDQLERVSITVATPENDMADYAASSGTFSAPGGPDFDNQNDKPMHDGIMNEMDPFNGLPDPEGFDAGYDDDGMEDWESYLAEPSDRDLAELEAGLNGKTERFSNDMKGKLEAVDPATAVELPLGNEADPDQVFQDFQKNKGSSYGKVSQQESIKRIKAKLMEVARKAKKS